MAVVKPDIVKLSVQKIINRKFRSSVKSSLFLIFMGGFSSVCNKKYNTVNLQQITQLIDGKISATHKLTEFLPPSVGAKQNPRPADCFCVTIW